MFKLQFLATKHDWEACKKELALILVQIDDHKSSSICLEYFKLYQSRWESTSNLPYYLGNRLNEIQGSKLFTSDGNDLPSFPDMDLYFEDAKLRAIKWALFYFWSASKYYDYKEIKSEKLAESISSVINIIRLEQHYWIPFHYDMNKISKLSSSSYWEFLWQELAGKLADLSSTHYEDRNES